MRAPHKGRRSCARDDMIAHSRFTGLFGTYYALQYLSLSDATVLSFLTPMTTAVTGALFLKETLTLKQVSASGAPARLAPERPVQFLTSAVAQCSASPVSF